MNQQGDVRLYHTHDGGEIDITGGLAAMDGGLETAAYLSLFGGNEDDDGLALNPATWWGNLDEIDPTRHQHSETQYLLAHLPATPANLRRIEDAAGRDLKWMVEKKVATAVTVAATMPGLNRVHLAVHIQADGADVGLDFNENWRASA
jgi:phage gp46-like protein